MKKSGRFTRWCPYDDRHSAATGPVLDERTYVAVGRSGAPFPGMATGIVRRREVFGDRSAPLTSHRLGLRARRPACALLKYTRGVRRIQHGRGGCSGDSAPRAMRRLVAARALSYTIAGSGGRGASRNRPSLSVCPIRRKPACMVRSLCDAVLLLGPLPSHLTRPSVVVDAVEHRSAFEEWASSSEPDVCATVPESDGPDVLGGRVLT